MAETRIQPCPACEGKKTCPSCEGTGIIDRLIKMVCAICSGRGTCGLCRGTGEIEDPWEGAPRSVEVL